MSREIVLKLPEDTIIMSVAIFREHIEEDGSIINLATSNCVCLNEEMEGYDVDCNLRMKYFDDKLEYIE